MSQLTGNETSANVLKEKYISEYYRSFSGDGFGGVREEAIKRFAELGFPTVKNEEWRFTNVIPALNHDYSPILKEDTAAVTREKISGYLTEGVKVNLLVFVNGYYVSGLSEILEGDHLKVDSLRGLSRAEDSFLGAHFAKYLGLSDGFSALNTALFTDGAVIRIADNSELEYPVHLLFLSGGSSGENLLIQPRNIILAGKNSRAKVIESYNSLGGDPYLINSATEIFLDEYSILHNYVVQDDDDSSVHINKTQVEQMGSSVFNSTVITLGGKMVRNDLNSRLAEKYAECNINGLYLTDGKRHIDNHTLIDHTVPECHSNELYKGIMEDDSRAVFNGKVIVRKDAQKTLAYQSNKNLLLSMGARVNTKPQLEIFADDVKCSHGATVGRMDEESLFYLRSRGISMKSARSILIHAFASDVIDRISIEPLRDKLNVLILKNLHDVE